MSRGAQEPSFSPLYDRLVPGEGASVLVRRATVEDVVAVTALHGYLQRMHTETHPDVFTVFDPEVTRPHFEGILASDEALIWVAEIEGEAAWPFAGRGGLRAVASTRVCHATYLGP